MMKLFTILYSVVGLIATDTKTEDCAIEWHAADGEDYTSNSVVCWRVNSKAYNYHCWDERTCKNAEHEPSNSNSGWSQNGMCAQPLCKPRPSCVENGITCSSSDECCKDSVCRSTVCSSYNVSDNMILYENFRLKVTPFTEIFEIRKNGKITLHHNEETERMLIEQYASEYGIGSPSVKNYPIAVSFEYGLERPNNPDEFIDFSIRIYEQNFDFDGNSEFHRSNEYVVAPTSFYPYLTTEHRMNSERQTLYLYEKNVPYNVFIYPSFTTIVGSYGELGPQSFENVDASIKFCLMYSDECGGFSYYDKGNGNMIAEYHRASIEKIRNNLSMSPPHRVYTLVAIDRSKMQQKSSIVKSEL